MIEYGIWDRTYRISVLNCPLGFNKSNRHRNMNTEPETIVADDVVAEVAATEETVANEEVVSEVEVTPEAEVAAE